ncbi:MAG: molybdenum cofactor guanylyltransferase MobA [Gammaproteobacteria bacterium]|nr:molybdenum cofactor guanylyltransferase MobA [Gammaproteobacteria bacterium]
MAKYIISRANITGIILSGGRATRMDGQDKGLIELKGQPFIAHVIHRLAPQVNHIRINANRNIEAYHKLGQKFGYPVFTDTNQDFQGPLSGMLAAMKSETQHDWLLCVPCDAPLFPADLAERFIRSVNENSRIAVAHDGKWMQPTFCLLHCSLADSLEQFLASGERKTGHWMRQQQAINVDFSDQKQAFANINTPEELQLIQSLL